MSNLLRGDEASGYSCHFYHLYNKKTDDFNFLQISEELKDRGEAEVFLFNKIMISTRLEYGSALKATQSAIIAGEAQGQVFLLNFCIFMKSDLISDYQHVCGSYHCKYKSRRAAINVNVNVNINVNVNVNVNVNIKGEQLSHMQATAPRTKYSGRKAGSLLLRRSFIIVTQNTRYHCKC